MGRSRTTRPCYACSATSISSAESVWSKTTLPSCMPPFSILSISTLSGAWPSIWPAVITSPCPIPLEKTIDQVRSRLFTGRSVHFRPRPMPLFSRVPAGSGRYPLFDLRPYPSPCFLLSSQLWGIRPAYPHEYPYPEIVTCIIFWVQTQKSTEILIQWVSRLRCFSFA